MLSVMFYLRSITDGVHAIYLQIGPRDMGEES